MRGVDIDFVRSVRTKEAASSLSRDAWRHAD